MKRILQLAMLFAAGAILPACTNDVTEPTVVPDEAQAQPETRAFGDKSPIVVTYNECNDCDPRNVLNYKIGDDLFVDLEICFAATFCLMSRNTSGPSKLLVQKCRSDCSLTTKG